MNAVVKQGVVLGRHVSVRAPLPCHVKKQGRPDALNVVVVTFSVTLDHGRTPIDVDVSMSQSDIPHIFRSQSPPAFYLSWNEGGMHIPTAEICGKLLAVVAA